MTTDQLRDEIEKQIHEARLQPIYVPCSPYTKRIMQKVAESYRYVIGEDLKTLEAWEDFAEEKAVRIKYINEKKAEQRKRAGL